MNLPEFAQTAEENERLRDQLIDQERDYEAQLDELQIENSDLKAQLNELRAQLGYLHATRQELGTPVMRSRDGWVERYENGEWVRDHEVTL